MKWIKTKQVRNRIFYTIFMLIIFQIGTYLTLPGISMSSNLNESPLSTLLNLTSGGALSRFGILALGVSPYISASIVVQILSKGLSKKYTELQEQGHYGNIKLAQYTRYWSLIFGFVSGLAILFTTDLSILLSVNITASFYEKILLCIILAIGSLFVSYIGDSINQNGIGNGQSLIITTGILTSLPIEIMDIFNTENFVRTKSFYISVGIMAITLIAIIIFTYLANNKEYRLPVQNKTSFIKTHAHYIPIKLLASSVVPIIFATSSITIVSTLYVLIKNEIAPTWLDYETWEGLVLYSILIFLFTYLYNYIQIDSKRLTKDIAQSSMYIIGVSNNETESYLNKKILHLSNIGAPVLTILATASIIVAKLSPLNLGLTLTGVSLLIVVSSIQEVYNQIKGLTDKNNYKEIL